MTKDELVRALDDLPADTLPELRQFIEFLHFKAQSRPKKLARLGGLWKDLPPITDQDIAQVRQELWGSFGERDL
jgi:hypothetical protein